ncbi:scavenger receptor cysteine-rich type 1 protein M130-like [Ostrea edulis]|uniref:scavenger receptor cysteine-rich type 1 protein M130-like n=1 Tax=Ostrea edulis TaxID=37623 RepID=UPI0024AF1D24|nr:scavenger receptor cysteine-rich type 1 protein M130-like [Ostrea edulis]
MLGHTGATAVAVSEGVLGFGRGLILLDAVECVGNETELGKCVHKPFGDHNCDHIEDAGVLCLSGKPNVKVRLRGGLYETKGRVEIQAFGIWGTICMNGFGVEEVKVICRQLGYPGSGTFEKHGYGSGPIWMADLACVGNETTIEECPRKPWGVNNCNHFHDIGVTCSTQES